MPKRYFISPGFAVRYRERNSTVNYWPSKQLVGVKRQIEPSLLVMAGNFMHGHEHKCFVSAGSVIHKTCPLLGQVGIKPQIFPSSLSIPATDDGAFPLVGSFLSQEVLFNHPEDRFTIPVSMAIASRTTREYETDIKIGLTSAANFAKMLVLAGVKDVERLAVAHQLIGVNRIDHHKLDTQVALTTLSLCPVILQAGVKDPRAFMLTVRTGHSSAVLSGLLVMAGNATHGLYEHFVSIGLATCRMCPLMVQLGHLVLKRTVLRGGVAGASLGGRTDSLPLGAGLPGIVLFGRDSINRLSGKNQVGHEQKGKVGVREHIGLKGQVVLGGKKGAEF